MIFIQWWLLSLLSAGMWSFAFAGILNAMQNEPEIKKIVRIVRLEDKKTDAAYWRKQPYAARLAALEELRQEYHRWRDGAEPGFQRVYKITKR